MRIRITPDAGAAADLAARIIAGAVRARPESVLGLATGGTMEAVYRGLVARHRAGEVSFARARSFNLDEYVGLAPAHPASYAHYMKERFLGAIDMANGAGCLPRGDAPDADAEAARYEAAIRAAGGIDVQLLGLGVNAHIGFNEPSSSLASLTRVVTLAHETRAANSRFFGPGESPPARAITMGIGTIMRARRVVLVALGTAKERAVAQVVEGPVSARWPGSILQMHPDATVILDRAAASGLELLDYYLEVQPDGG